MSPTIGVNLRVTGHCSQGGRKYMEDMFSVAYQHTRDEKDLEYAYFGIFDGHGGREAALFAKDHLMEAIVRQKSFWSGRDEDVVRAIREGFIQTHLAMWRQLDYWPKTASGLPSTSGTTASVVFIRHGKIYLGHVGDSSVVLGYQQPGESFWRAECLTTDHKPELEPETSRIERAGGKVVNKSGVARIVWNRPRIGHKGPVRRSTPIDEIPFLAVARSLGDLWSYNSELDRFIVSPEPDVRVIPCQPGLHRCLILATDGLWNVLEPDTVVNIVRDADTSNELRLIRYQYSDTPSTSTPYQSTVLPWLNPSKCLVDRALARWSCTKLRADNTTALTLLLDPPGPPKTKVILKNKTHSKSPEAINNTSSPFTKTIKDNPANMLQMHSTNDSRIVMFARYHQEAKAPFQEDKITSVPDSSNEDSPAPSSSSSSFDIGVISPSTFRTGLSETPESIQSNEVTSSSPEEVEEIFRHSHQNPKYTGHPQLIDHDYYKPEGVTLLSESSSSSIELSGNNNNSSPPHCSSESKLHRSRNRRRSRRRYYRRNGTNNSKQSSNKNIASGTIKYYEKRKRDMTLRLRHPSNNVMSIKRQRKTDTLKISDHSFGIYPSENSLAKSSYSKPQVDRYSLPTSSDSTSFRRKSFGSHLNMSSPLTPSTRMTRSISAASKRILRSGKNFKYSK